MLVLFYVNHLYPTYTPPIYLYFFSILSHCFLNHFLSILSHTHTHVLNRNIVTPVSVDSINNYCKDHKFYQFCRNLVPVTQLYVSVDASTKDSLKKIDRPLFKDFWDRFIGSLQALADKVQKLFSDDMLQQCACNSSLVGNGCWLQLTLWRDTSCLIIITAHVPNSCLYQILLDSPLSI